MPSNETDKEIHPLLKFAQAIDANPIKRRALLEALQKVSAEYRPPTPESLQALQDKFKK